jgi:hypothetical protein
MNKKIFAPASICSLLFILISCQKQALEMEVEQTTVLETTFTETTSAASETTTFHDLSLNIKPLHPKQIHSIAMKLQKKINKIKESSKYRTNESFSTEEDIILTKEIQEISNIISPLVQNGRQIYNELISQLINRNEWHYLTEEDRSSILNFNSEAQFTDLALIYSTTEFDTNLNLEAMRVDAGVIKDCVSFAIGIDAISSLISNTAALKTVSGAIQILKIVGKRYLNYVGIVWMIWDFSDCISHFI